MKYRAEIDGLRAFAVLPVILFHAGLELFSGGFVGVDVFFVISGYLITTILIEEIHHKQFSIANFYERRLRRILPALFFVTLVCLPFAWALMLPSQMKDFSQSLIAISFFASNILFWRESGYFAAAAEEKPLLHTWSLAVEEQYYVFFPIFLLFVWRLGRNKVIWMVVAVAVVSLILSEWGWRNKPTANFYLSPTRAWELLAGSTAAFIAQRRGIYKNNTLALLGLIAIVFSIFVYDESTPFPSLYTLLPVFGVVLLILYGEKDTVAAKLLSTKILVGIGLVSYSAYLWHQPLFAFLRMQSTIKPTLAAFLIASTASLVLAYFTWKYIETPFRNKRKFTRTQIFLFSAAGGVLYISIGIFGYFKDGFPERYSNNTAYQNAQLKLAPNQGLSEFCGQNSILEDTCATSVEPEILVWGDSYAMHLVPGIINSINDAHLRQATVSQCAPIIGYAVATAFFGAENCIHFNNSVHEYLSNSSIKYVVLASPFARLQDNQSVMDREGKLHSNGSEITLKGIISLVNDIREMGKIPIIFTPPPVDGSDLGSCLLRHELRGQPLENCNFRREEIHPTKLKIINQLQEIPNVNIIDLTELICDDEMCHSSFDGIYLFRDTGHLSIEGSILLGKTYNFYNLIVSSE